MSDVKVLLKRQKVLADFGDLALQSEDLDSVLTEACRLVAEALGTARAKVLEIEPGGRSLLLRAGVGWRPEIVGRLRVSMGRNSSEAYAIAVGEPVITRDMAKEDRFDLPDFMKAEGVVAMANVPIFLPGRRVYGLLQADDTEPRDFDRDDIEFLRTYAAILGPIIDRLFRLQELRATEERYRAIVETVMDYGIFTTDPEGRIEAWPAGAQAVYGWPPEEATGLSMDMTFTPEDQANGAPAIERLTARTAGVAPDVRWHVRRDGSRVFIDGATRPLTGPDGALAGYVKVGQDVTDRRRAEEQLQLATEAAALGIFDVELATGAIAWDARMRELWAVGPDEPITDHTFMAGIHPEDRERVRSALGEALDPQGAQLYKVEYRLRPGETHEARWVAAQGRAHFDGARPVRLVGVVQDVTERRRVEAALRESEERHRAELERQVLERTSELRASRDLLGAIIDSSPDMVQVFEAVRDERGGIVDFRWVLNNHAAERQYGEVRGESLLERNPGVLVEGIFDAFRRVTETGVPETAERRYVHEQFDGWFLQSVVKLDDGVATTTKDITAWRRAQEEVLRLRDEVAQARLRESEERLAAIFVNASVGLSEIALDGRFLEVNGEFCRILGRTREEALRLSVPSVTHPEDLQASREAIAGARAGSGSASLDKRYQRPDGTQVWANSRVSVLHHGRDRPDTLLAVTIDLTERRAAEAAMRESEARFRQFGDASGDVLWIRNAESLEFEYVSPAVEEVYGIRADVLLGGNQMLRWAGMIVPEDRDKALDAIRRVRAGEHVLHTFRILRRADGKVRWIRDHSFPLLDAEGRVQRIGGIGHDATKEVELHDRLQVLVAELQHRTRNLMGVVRSVTDKTLSGSTSLEDFQGRIRDRLNALARVNGLLSRLDGGSRITFDELLRTELMAHGVVGPEEPLAQVRLEGPEGIRLRSSTVQILALGLHELATNALKYGALSRPEGRLSVTWELLDSPQGEPRLRVDWRESGVTVLTVVPDRASGREPTAPRRRGYGRELIERALPYQLKAETSYELTPQGLRCSITLPVSPTMGRIDWAKEDPDA